MRIAAMLLFALLFSIAGYAKADEYTNITISGTVESPDSRSIRVVLYTYVPGENPMSSTALLGPDNTFQFVSYIREPMFGSVFYGEERIPVYLEPGYDIRIRFDARNLKESVSFEGVGERNNSFLSERQFKFSLDATRLQAAIQEQDEAGFRAWANARRQAQHELLNTKKPALSSSFVGFQEADIDYAWANELFAFAQHKGNNSLQEEFYDFMDELKLHNYEQISLQSYRNFLENYVQYNYRLMGEEATSPNEQYYRQLYKTARLSLRSLPMYHMQATYLVQALKEFGVDKVKDEYIEFANECPKQAYKNVLHQLVKEQTISPKEPEIIFTDARGSSITLKELSGKIVLLRFTNYSNDSSSLLLQEHNQNLQEKLSGYEDVRFLELPMQINREAFQKMVYADATEYLKSIMNRPKPGQAKPKDPPFSYILLNREGLVVSNSLDDPHNELALEKIDALLRQEKRTASNSEQ